MSGGKLRIHPGRSEDKSDQSVQNRAFHILMRQTPRHAQAWSAAIQGLNGPSPLDRKTAELAYLAVLAALRLESGIPFQVQSARKAGASREEVISAILVGVPAAGHAITQILPAAMAAYDAE